MANNRLYIRDKATGELFFLAKSNAPRGWQLACKREEIQAWLDGRDLAAVDADLDTFTRLELLDDKSAEQLAIEAHRRRRAVQATVFAMRVAELLDQIVKVHPDLREKVDAFCDDESERWLASLPEEDP
jgi:hypothetical protein